MKFVKISLQTQTDNFESIALLGTWFDMFQRTERNGHILKRIMKQFIFLFKQKSRQIIKKIEFDDKENLLYLAADSRAIYYSIEKFLIFI